MEMSDTSRGILLLALLWALPYASGMMFHNYLMGYRLRAIGWMFIVLFGLYRGTIPAMILSGYVFILSSPLKTIWFLTFAGMFVQLIFWWYMWFKFRRTRRIFGWRTATVAAFLVLMLIPMYNLLLAGFWCALILILIMGWVWYKDRTRGEAGGWHTVTNAAFYMSLLIVSIMTFTYGTYTMRHLKLNSENRELLESVGYQPYPGVDDPACITMTRVEGFSGDADGHLHIGFRTDDSQVEVFSFYRKCAEGAGLDIFKGTYGSGNYPVLIATCEGRAMKLEWFTDDRWHLDAYWETPGTLLSDYGTLHKP